MRTACAEARGHDRIWSCLWAFAHAASLPKAAFPYCPISTGPPYTPKLPSETSALSKSPRKVSLT